MNTLLYGKTLFVWLMIGILLSGCGGSPQALYERIQPEYEQLTSIEIPLRFEQGIPYITIETEAGKSELMLDTGANSVTIALSPEMMKGLEVRHVGRPHVLTSNYGSSIYRKFVLPEVSVGGLTYYNLLCDKDKLPTPGHVRKGMVGLALFKEFNVLIDYKEAKMILYRNNLYPKQEDVTTWQKIPFTAHNDGIMLQGVLQGTERELTLVVDTGAVARGENGESFNPMKGSSLKKIAGIHADEEDGFKFLRAHDLIVGDVVIHSLNFIFVDQFEQPSSLDGGTLGYDFFLKHKVFFDFGKMMMYIKRHA
jgi:hypothetical protein